MEELKEQLLKGIFYYSKDSLMVEGKVYNIVSYAEGKLEIFFTGGIVGTYQDKIKKVRRPDNILNSFKWCYKLRNENDECIGYIGDIDKK